MLPSELEKRNMNDIIATKKYIFAHGNIPVLLVAHLDTVHTQVKKIIKKKEIIKKKKKSSKTKKIIQKKIIKKKSSNKIKKIC